jgi:thioredoxin-related protein
MDDAPGRHREHHLAGAALPALLLTAAAAWAQPAGLPFRDSLQAALRVGEANKKVVVAYFTAPWCPWCRKMSVATLSDRRVVTLADRFVWARVDVGEQPELAARYDVRGLPMLVVLNARGERLADAAGYLTVPQLLKLLRPLVGKAEETPKQGAIREGIARITKALAEARKPEDWRKAVAEAVGFLARPQRGGRGIVLELLDKLEPAQWPLLLEAMGDKRLAIRAAAGAALASVTGADLPFDAFAKAEVRKRQIAAWGERVRKGRTPKQPTTSPAGRS